MSASTLVAAVAEHEKWRTKECVNLIPSENITSPRVRRLLATDLGHRYTSDENFYMGTKHLDKVEKLGESVARDLFGAESAVLRPLSGHVADMILLSLYTKPGDTIISVDPRHGGYSGIAEKGFPKFLSLKNLYFPFDREEMNIKVGESADLIKNTRPTLVFFGASFILFPHPVRELAAVAHDVGAIVAFDGSHVMGLIAGREFQDPLSEGADILLGSTHKSFFGPQGGMILGRREIGENVKTSVHPPLVDNAHWNRIAALSMALIESKRYGGGYARQVIKNSKALAKTLHDNGLPVICAEKGYTQSHQVILDYGGFKMGREYAERLQHANIIVDSGVRLGTSEVTRLGMREGEMELIAELISRVVVKREDPHLVKREVKRFRRKFTRIRFA